MNKTIGGNSKPASGENLDGSDADRIEAQANTNAASRAIAVMVLMIVLGVAGSYLDKWMGTQFFVVIGFVLGIGILIFGLLYVARIADLAAKKARELRKSTDSKGDEGESAGIGHE
jgi:F0F1-type ATP synthase assembly protein I